MRIVLDTELGLYHLHPSRPLFPSIPEKIPAAIRPAKALEPMFPV